MRIYCHHCGSDRIAKVFATLLVLFRCRSCGAERPVKARVRVRSNSLSVPRSVGSYVNAMVAGRKW